MTKMLEDHQNRFRSKILVLDNGCWSWLGSVFPDGYGAFQMGIGDTRRAHRLSYEWWKGEIPERFDVHHECYNILCVNPDHLEVMSHSDNLARRRDRIYG